MAATILYDIGRIVDRLNAPMPTGIDRIDLRYLLHFEDFPKSKVIGVAIRRGKMIAVPDRYFRQIADLARRKWIGSQKLGLEVWRARTQIRLWMAFQRRITGVLDRQISDLSGRFIYVNAAHSHHKGADAFSALKARTGSRVVCYIHDLIPYEHPEFARPGHGPRHADLMRVTAQYASQVITNSQHTAHRFQQFCETKKLGSPPTSVLYPGVEPVFIAAAEYRDPGEDIEPYFVAVGTIEPRKNLSMLLRLWLTARKAKSSLPQLRIIGQPGWTTSANADTAKLLTQLGTDVAVFSDLDDKEMIRQLSGARALLFPSHAEGWGLPLAEACTLGVPSIVSDLPALRESSQNRALFLDPEDINAWETAIRHFAAPGSPRRAAALTALYDYQPNTWEHHFQLLDDLMDM